LRAHQKGKSKVERKVEKETEKMSSKARKKYVDEDGNKLFERCSFSDYEDDDFYGSSYEDKESPIAASPSGSNLGFLIHFVRK
jgi:hypothetical protein